MDSATTTEVWSSIKKRLHDTDTMSVRELARYIRHDVPSWNPNNEPDAVESAISVEYSKKKFVHYDSNDYIKVYASNLAELLQKNVLDSDYPIEFTIQNVKNYIRNTPWLDSPMWECPSLQES